MTTSPFQVKETNVSLSKGMRHKREGITASSGQPQGAGPSSNGNSEFQSAFMEVFFAGQINCLKKPSKGAVGGVSLTNVADRLSSGITQRRIDKQVGEGSAIGESIGVGSIQVIDTGNLVKNETSAFFSGQKGKGSDIAKTQHNHESKSGKNDSGSAVEPKGETPSPKRRESHNVVSSSKDMAFELKETKSMARKGVEKRSEAGEDGSTKMVSKSVSGKERQENITGGKMTTGDHGEETGRTKSTEDSPKESVSARVLAHAGDHASNRIGVMAEGPIPDGAALTGGPGTNVSKGDIKTLEAAQSEKPKSASQNSGINQIVEKAFLNMKNGLQEFRIELKPESFGHLKMVIPTEDHQVRVKMVAESHHVKEMIEGNLYHLKSAFQGQGLNVDMFDVSVGRDSRHDGTAGLLQGIEKTGVKGVFQDIGDLRNGFQSQLAFDVPRKGTSQRLSGVMPVDGSDPEKISSKLRQAPWSPRMGVEGTDKAGEDRSTKMVLKSVSAKGRQENITGGKMSTGDHGEETGRTKNTEGNPNVRVSARVLAHAGDHASNRIGVMAEGPISDGAALTGGPGTNASKGGIKTLEAAKSGTLRSASQNSGINQIVEKAFLNMKNGLQEFRIELKPESLGQVKVQVSTEKQQVIIRIITELPLAKEMIENNVQQLKADLQGHGLEIERFEVSLSHGADRGGVEHGFSQLRKTKKRDDQKGGGKSVSSTPDMEMEAWTHYQKPGNASINLFA